MVRPLKICLVAPSTRQVGGHAVQAAELRRWLQSTGQTDVEFVATDGPLPRPFRMLERVWGVRTLLRHMGLALTIVRVGRGCDVIHVFAPAYWSFLLSAGVAVLAGRWADCPVIVNYHSGEAPQHLRDAPRAVSWVLRRAALVVVPSPFLARVFADHGYEVDVIRNAVDLSRFQWRRRRPPFRRILCTRRFEAHYDVTTAIRAFAVLCESHPDAHLTLVGEGADEPSVRRLTDSLRLGSAVTFAGSVPHAEIERYYEDHDVYLNSSVVDNQPLSLLEAMASGLVVVTTSAGGIVDLIADRQTGRLAPVGAPDLLAVALRETLDDEQTFDALAAAARDVVANHDPLRVVHDWIWTYRRVARQWTRGR